MKNNNNKVAILGGSRIPFAKSFTAYNRTSNSDLMSAALNGLVDKFQLQGKQLGDVSLGTLIHYPGEWNWAKENVSNTELDPHTPAHFISRACGTSLDAANTIALKIASGQINSGIAGGSLAIGHPFAATGARVLAGAAKILKENGGGRCLISICTAGGMGTAAIIEA